MRVFAPWLTQISSAPQKVSRFRLEDVLAAAAEAEHRPAHAFDRDVAGQDEQVGPADCLPYFCLIGHSRRRALSRLPLSGQLLSGSKRCCPLWRRRAVGHAISARGMPRHADQERAVMAVVGRPPRLAVGHQRGEIGLQRLIIERLERLGIVEVRPIGPGETPFWWSMSTGSASGHQSLLVLPSSERARPFIGAALIAGLCVHDADLSYLGLDPR